MPSEDLLLGIFYIYILCHQVGLMLRGSACSYESFRTFTVLVLRQYWYSRTVVGYKYERGGTSAVPYTMYGTNTEDSWLPGAAGSPGRTDRCRCPDITDRVPDSPQFAILNPDPKILPSAARYSPADIPSHLRPDPDILYSYGAYIR